MTAWLPECVRHLPVVDGKPVPWVAIWSAERRGPTMTMDRNGLVPASRNEPYVRREFGMWMLTTPTRREGTPDFGSTHSARQRKSMRELRCQVCGRAPAEGGGQRLWTIPPNAEHSKLWLDHLVLNPLTCEDCWRLVTQPDGPCPYVANVKVPAFTGRPGKVWGVSGTLMLPGDRERDVAIPFGHPHLPWVLGRELIMQLTDPRPYRWDRDPIAAAAGKIR